jgi:hypothetical protein
LDAGHTVHQISDASKADISEDVKKTAKEMAEKALKQKLHDINMKGYENDVYEEYLAKVIKQSQQLRVVLEQAEARKQERQWLTLQTQGELDDNRLVDALTGENNVYKKRGVPDSKIQGLQFQQQPKRILFVMDVSGSMYRFNGVDKRLERLLEATLLIMDAFDGFDHKFSYSIVGHSGDSPRIPLVEYNQPPKSRKEKLQVLQTMYAHSQY